MFPPRSPADTSLEFEPDLVPSHPRTWSDAQPINFSYQLCWLDRFHCPLVGTALFDSIQSDSRDWLYELGWAEHCYWRSEAYLLYLSVTTYSPASPTYISDLTYTTFVIICPCLHESIFLGTILFEVLLFGRVGMTPSDTCYLLWEPALLGDALPACL